MSDLEYYAFLNLQYDTEVIDIREQYPLLPLEQIILIAKKLQICHIPKTRNEKNVMPTDFIVTFRNYEVGKLALPKLEAIAIDLGYII